MAAREPLVTRQQARALVSRSKPVNPRLIAFDLAICVKHVVTLLPQLLKLTLVLHQVAKSRQCPGAIGQCRFDRGQAKAGHDNRGLGQRASVARMILAMTIALAVRSVWSAMIGPHRLTVPSP
jgi:hypothetical protein